MTEETIFAEALLRPDPADRARFLADACGPDPALRGRIEGLLAAHSAAGDFLRRPPAGSPPPAGDDVTRTGGFTPPPDEDLGFLDPPTRPDAVGRLGHYEVLELLGRGGFGIVFRAFDDTLQRVVAVKVLAPHVAATSPARKRFAREATSFAQVRHENVVQVYSVEEEKSLPYLVMEYIPGETLQQRLDRTGPLAVPEAVRIARQVAEGLAAAHATGLVHRDVKPGNVLIESGPHQRVKLTDFGLARAADDASLSQSGVVAGTPLYMAPEQAKGETLDHRADLFSLGSVLYTMLTGRPPFRATTTLAVLKRVAEDTPRPIREVIPEVPEWLCRVVEKLHAKDPADRFPSAREVADLLADCEAQLRRYGAVRDFARIPGGKPQWRPRRTPFAKAMMISGLIGFWVVGLIATVAGLYWRTQAPPPPDVRAQLAVNWEEKGLVVMVFGANGVEYVSEGMTKGTGVMLAPGTYTVRAQRGGEVVFERKVVLGPGEHLGVDIPPPAGAGPAAGWVPLFNGRDLTGWATAFGAPGAWAVRDGAIVGTGPLSCLATERRDYRDFHLRVEVKINAGGDGGVYCRGPIGTPDGVVEAQILGGPGENPTGTLLHKSFPPVRPAKPGAMTPDEWFTYEIIAQGRHVETRVNGRLGAVTEAAPLLGGPIGLESFTRGTVVHVRKVEIRELPRLEEPPAGAWVPLFNGADLAGWKAHPLAPAGDDWRVEAGTLVGRAGGPTAFLFSDAGGYADFHLRAEVKVNGTGDAGVFVRAPFEVRSHDRPTKVFVPGGYEVQITGRPDWQIHTGSVLDAGRDLLCRAPPGTHRPDEWFVLEVIAEGDRIRTRVNGAVTADYRDDRGRYTRGHLALQAWGDGVTTVGFRKIEIKELPPALPAADPAGAALRGAVAAARTARDIARAKFDAGTAHSGDLAAAEAALCEARITLADAEHDAAKVAALLADLVTHRKEVRRVVKERVDAGKDAPALLAEADAALAAAQARLARVTPDPSPEP